MILLHLYLYQLRSVDPVGIASDLIHAPSFFYFFIIIYELIIICTCTCISDRSQPISSSDRTMYKKRLDRTRARGGRSAPMRQDNARISGRSRSGVHLTNVVSLPLLTPAHAHLICTRSGYSLPSSSPHGLAIGLHLLIVHGRNPEGCTSTNDDSGLLQTGQGSAHRRLAHASQRRQTVLLDHAGGVRAFFTCRKYMKKRGEMRGAFFFCQTPHQGVDI